MRLHQTLILVSFLFYSLPSYAAVCKNVFQAVPVGNHSYATMITPGNIMGGFDYICNSGSCTSNGYLAADNIPQGEHVNSTVQINNTTINNTSYGISSRFYVQSLTVSNGNINPNGDPEDFIIHVGGNVNISGTSKINALVYAAGSITLSNTAVVNGAIAAEGGITLNDDSAVIYDANAIAVTDFDGMCSDQTNELRFRFGTTNSTSVTFDRPFPPGAKPLVFLMPTVDSSDPAADGPATLFIDSISNTGFTFSQSDPPEGSAVVTPSQTMTDISWIAATPGTFTLDNGTTLTIGSVFSRAAALGRQPASVRSTSVPIPTNADVALHQLQIKRGSFCWFYSYSPGLTSGTLKLGFDVGEIGGENTCDPGNHARSDLEPEHIAFMAVESGSGITSLDGQSVRFEFGTDATVTGHSAVNGCNNLKSLTNFNSVPTFIVGSLTRGGSDGFWFRRCQLSTTNFSVIAVEDQYDDSENYHYTETYGYVALEPITPSLSCISDNFNRASVGNNWVTYQHDANNPVYINNNRLNLTREQTQQLGMAVYQQLLPAAGNLIEVEFDQFAWSTGSVNGADGMGIVFSDSDFSPVQMNINNSMGYSKSNSHSGFPGGWIGIGLDEYGGYSNPAGGKVGGPGQSPNHVAIRGSSASDYEYITGVAVSPDLDIVNTPSAGNDHRFRIVLDSRPVGQTWLSVERDIKDGNGYSTVIAPFEVESSLSSQGSIPTNFYLTFTGATYGKTNNHEIDNLQICSASTPVDFIHHFQLDYSNPLTCQAETVTVKACQNAPCSVLHNNSLSVSLSTTNQNVAYWNAPSQVLNNGAAQTTLQGLTTAPVTIGASGSILQLAANYCSNNGGVATNANCTFSFADSGFLVTVPDKQTNNPITATVKAVRLSDNGQACTPAFSNVGKSIEFWGTYVSPSAPLNNNGSLPRITLGGNNINMSAASPTALNMTFNAQGEGVTAVNYPDAGELTLHAKYTAPAGAADEGLILEGSDTFVNVPVGMCVETTSNCAAGDESCPIYKKAGEDFTLSISGRAWVSNGDTNFCDNPVTPNYEQAGIALGHNLVSPAGGETGTLGTTSYNHTKQLNGINTVTQTISEVGVFEFTVDPPAGYLGSAAPISDISQAISDNTGRFVPAYFSFSNTDVTPGCGIGALGFSYMDQDYEIDFTVEALNQANQLTENYEGNYVNSTVSLVAENSNNGTNLASRLSTAPTLSWNNGQAQISNFNVSLARPSAPSVSGTFLNLVTGVTITDGDSIAEIISPNMNPSASGNCANAPNTCTAIELGTQSVLFGRINIENTYGSSDSLNMGLQTEYWSDATAKWETNALDTCTSSGSNIDQFNPAIPAGVNPANYTFSPSLVSGQTITRSSIGAVNQGEHHLTWQRQAAGVPQYRGKITAPLPVPSWLKFYWNWDGISPNVNDDPRGSVNFGTYRGHDKIVYKGIR